MTMLDRQPEARPHPEEAARPVPVRRTIGDEQIESMDALAVEEPLEIQLAFRGPQGLEIRNLSITMRTPGEDPELAVGFLFTEGIIRSRHDLAGLEALPSGPHGTCRSNRIRVALQERIAVDTPSLERNFYTTSSCGVCGKASIQALRTRSAFPSPSPGSGPRVPAALLQALPDRVRAAQAVFQATGGLHASALFAASGELLLLREDVGRHNALDKLIGSLALAEADFSTGTVVITSRASSEMIQKAASMGIGVVAAMGAPTSLAIRMAEHLNLTLLGFARHNRHVLYTGAHRVAGHAIQPGDAP